MCSSFRCNIGDWFRTTVGVRQGCLLSPTLFNIFLERIMTDALEDHEGTVSIGGRTVTNLRFADDILLSRRGRRTGKFSWASRQSHRSVRHEDQCREDRADDKQHHWHQHGDQSKWREAWDSHKLQVPGLSYYWWGFQAWDTLQDSTDDSSIDKVKTSLEWHKYFSQFQDMTDALPCHIHLPVCLWIMDPHSRVPNKNTSLGNEVLPQDTTHLIQRLCYQRGSPCQDPAGNRTIRRPPDHAKETRTAVVWSCLRLIRSGQNHLARHSKGRGRQGRQRKRWEDTLREWTGPEFAKSQRPVVIKEK